MKRYEKPEIIEIKLDISDIIQTSISAPTDYGFTKEADSTGAEQKWLDSWN